MFVNVYLYEHKEIRSGYLSAAPPKFFNLLLPMNLISVSAETTSPSYLVADFEDGIVGNNDGNKYGFVDGPGASKYAVQVTDGKVANFEGGAKLSGAPVTACDLRAGAAFIIAGLVATGVTEIDNIKHIQRGYEDIVGKLRGVGADITLVLDN